MKIVFTSLRYSFQLRITDIRPYAQLKSNLFQSKIVFKIQKLFGVILVYEKLITASFGEECDEVITFNSIY